MNLGPNRVKDSYQYVLNQSGANSITLGNGTAVNWNAGGVVALAGNQTIDGVKTFSSNPISTASQGVAGNSLTRRDFVENNLIISGYTFKDSANTFDLKSYAHVAGGTGNTASALYSNVAGGYSNTAIGNFSNVAGGHSNTASGYSSNVAGGESNAAIGYSANVAGGYSNTASGEYSNVAGGYSNTAIGDYSNVAGGALNAVSGNFSNVAGGESNAAIGYSANVAGGYSNTAIGDYSNVAGGYLNTVSGNYSNVAGGYLNTVSGNYSNVAGGELNTAGGEYSSIAGGRRAKIASNHSGAAVWADGQNRNHTSRGEHSCFLDFASGVYLRLPSFAGSKSQDGNLGELKISGKFLYVATGANLWGRTEILSF